MKINDELVELKFCFYIIYIGRLKQKIITNNQIKTKQTHKNKPISYDFDHFLSSEPKNRII